MSIVSFDHKLRQKEKMQKADECIRKYNIMTK